MITWNNPPPNVHLSPSRPHKLQRNQTKQVLKAMLLETAKKPQIVKRISEHRSDASSKVVNYDQLISHGF